MGTKNKAWHAAIDPPELIQMCLSCKRPKCVDCIGGKRATHTKRADINYKKDNGLTINKTDRAVFSLYPASKSDMDIARQLGRPRPTISNVRRKFNLPSPQASTEEERTRLVNIILGVGEVA